MNALATTAANIATAGVGYIHRLLKDIPAERFGRLAAPGGTPIPSNHPAFIVGHLSLYPQKTLEFLGMDTSPVQPPSHYEELFSKLAQCQDDSEGSIYPHRDEIVATFDQGYQVAIEAVRNASVEQFAQDNPVDSPLRKSCPTLGDLLTFYLTNHIAIHAGQMSAWRRMEGMSPA